MRSFRTIFRFLVPSWLQEGEGELHLIAVSAVKDMFMQRIREGFQARFPTRAPPSALPLIGAYRGITQGRAETNAHYAQRLVRWRYPRGHRVRGNAPSFLEQIWEYFGGGFALNSEQVNGMQWHRAADGTESTATVGGWDWDGDATKWARFWIVIDGTALIDPTPDFGDAALWGGQLGDSSYAVGHVGVSADDVVAIRKLFRGQNAWKPGGTRAMWAVVSINGAAPNPAGGWATWGQLTGTHYEAARDTVNQRYWALDPTALLHPGNPTQFAETFDGPDGVIAGDPTGFPAVISHNGVSFAGNPDNFPTSVKLIDDGSIP